MAGFDYTPGPLKTQLIRAISGDHEVNSLDNSPLREGSFSLSTSGDYFVAAGNQPVMKYWSHNLVTDLMGYFMGRDEADACSSFFLNEINQLRCIYGATGPRGSKPVMATTVVIDMQTGTITQAGYDISAMAASAVSAAAGTTYTTAQCLGGFIVRTGPTAGYSDTTPTAAQIVAAIPGCMVGSSFVMEIRNTVAFIGTILAGTGVTLAQTTTLAISSTRRYLFTVTNVASPAVTLTGISAGTL